MTVLVPIDALPNQELSIIIDLVRYDIRLIQCFEIMAIDITRDNIVIVQGQRCLPFVPLIPYRYVENGMGNFFFSTINDDFPNYLQINQTQQLWHISSAELEVIRAST